MVDDCMNNNNIDIALCDDAIGWLKSIKIRYIHGGDEAYDACRKRAIDIGCEAIELMKEQQPRNVKFTINDYTGLPVSHCPKCEMPISMYLYGRDNDGQIRFCPYCGQALKWEST